jgi:threonine 3-dehydrogenase
MKALGKLKKEPGIWLYDAPMPKVGPRDVLIKVKKTGICGTDLHIYTWDQWAKQTIPVPLTTGHEFFGIVAEVGKEVKSFKVGDRVSGEGHITCGICRNCLKGLRHLCKNTEGTGVNRTGCFSEYFVLPESNVVQVPKEIPDKVAAFLDPLGNAVHTALSFPLAGEDVLITGAGPIGLMTCAIARFVGARYIVITDKNDYRLKLAKKLGATTALNVTTKKLSAVQKELEITDGFGVGLEMSGSPAGLQTMIESIAHGGKIALLGILPDGAGINWIDVILKGLFIKGIYGREIFDTWFKMGALLQSGLDITPVITHTFPVDQYEKGFEAMANGQCGKVILDWA